MRFITEKAVLNQSNPWLTTPPPMKPFYREKYEKRKICQPNEASRLRIARNFTNNVELPNPEILPPDFSKGTFCAF